MRKHLTKPLSLLALAVLAVGGYLLVSGYASPRTRYPWKARLDPTTALAVRVPTPEGFDRIHVQRDSFGFWLRNLPLKPADAKVLRFDGSEWANGAWSSAAVIDIDTGAQDLQRGPQAVARLRAEYLYGAGDRHNIRFPLKDGSVAAFPQWCATQKREPSHESLRAFLDAIAPNLSAASLERATTPVKLADMRPGDVFLRVGDIERAAIVVDVAANPQARTRVFLLAHGDAPAQDMHVVNNAIDEANKPWFSANLPSGKVQTPEGEFAVDSLRRF